MFILKKGHQPGVYVPLRALFLVLAYFKKKDFEFQMFLQEGVPAVDIVFTNYLRHWNGLDYVPLVLKHLTRSRMYSFECKYLEE